jgi:diguanylate cyclase
MRRKQSTLYCNAIALFMPLMSRWFRSIAAVWRSTTTWRLVSCLLLGNVLPGLASAAQAQLVLSQSAPVVQVWPAVTLLSDPQRNLSIEQVLAMPTNFLQPQSAYAALGLRKDVIWLRAPFMVEPQADANAAKESAAQWLLDIDYPVLNRIDVYVLADGKIVQRALLGNAQPRAQRPLNSRSHAVALQLQPGTSYEMLLRVEAAGSMILPITLSTLSAFQSRALNEQMLQGVFTGVGLCLLLYSLAQWISLRESLYLKYAFLVTGSISFSLMFFGIGEQFLWSDIEWIEKHIAGLSALVAACGTALFVEHALGSDMSPRLRTASRWAAAVLALTAVAYALSLINIYVASAVVSTVGLTPALLGTPGAIARTRRGDRVGAYFLVAWIGYFISTAVMVGLVRGLVGVNFWTMHSFQIGATFDMLIFMRIATLRAQAVHLAAERAALERDNLISLAHSDPLTGLPNRRGLSMQLGAAVSASGPDNILAVYMLDLDGFKLVNDQFGHDVGDELLVTVAKRLRATVRVTDVVARLGGDEFVVMATGLQTHGQAKDLGLELLAAFSEPFDLTAQRCSVGVTIGYALSPSDSRDGAALLKRADAAMYDGKQAGKNCLRWAGY